MRVVFVNRYFFPDHSATSQILSDLAFALAEAGMDIHVVTSRLAYDDSSACLPMHESVRGVRVHRVWTSRFGRGRLSGRLFDYLTFCLAASFALVGLLRRGDVAVAKTDPPLVSVPVWMIARWRGAALVNWLQDLFPEVAAALGITVARGWMGRSLAWLRDRTLLAAHANVVLGARMAQLVQERGVDTARIVVMPNWADGNAIKPLPAEANTVRADWGLTGKFVAAYSGNLGRAHEFDTILETAVRLQDDHNIVFLFIGGGHGHARLQAEAARRGLRNMQFKTYQPRDKLGLSLTLPDVHLISLLPELEGLIVPSKFYGVAAAGRPIAFIGAADGELAMEITRCTCGATVSPGDAAGLVAFLCQLRDDPEMGTDMGQRIRVAFDAKWNQPHAVAAWQRVLTRIGSEMREISP